MSTTTDTPNPPANLTKKDFVSDQMVRWCPGCGDYAILAQAQFAFAELGIPKENFVIISGIGCSSRFPYYMDTFGFHTIHGRAPALATGLKATRPELSVWIVTGDGDSLSIGGNHVIHLLRRNVDVNVMMFNNQIYGLTKGQYSPTSEVGKKTKSTPYGSLDQPFNPLALALGANASYVARSIDILGKHLRQTMVDAEHHRGTSFIEIYQNCIIFNDNAFSDFTDKKVRSDRMIELEHGKPMVFGKDRDKGLVPEGLALKVVALGDGIGEEDCLFHDETNLLQATLLARMDTTVLPVPIGVIYRKPRPTYDSEFRLQVDAVTERLGAGDIEQLLIAGDTWTAE